MKVRLYSYAVALIAAAGWATPHAEAQFCIDFETLPDGTPTVDQQLIFDEYPGVTFWITLPNNPDVIIGTPRIGQVGNPHTAFLSCWGVDAPDPSLGLGTRFLTDDNTPGLVGNLLIRYNPSVRQTGGLLIDTDFRPNGTYEEWTITARDQAGNTIGGPLVRTAPPGPSNDCPDPNGAGDGKTLKWQFDLDVDIYSVWLQYTGTAGQVGIAFDSFCPDSLLWTDSPCVDPPPGMVAWWPLDETETNQLTVEDTVGGHTGNRINTPTPVVGMVDAALEFDGVGEYVEVPDNDALDFGTGDFSIDAWIFLDEDGGGAWHPIVNKTDRPAISAGYEFMVTEPDHTLSLWLAGGGGGSLTYTSVATVPTGVWTHVAVTFSHQCPQPECSLSPARFYINGLGGQPVFLSFAGNVDNSSSLAIGAGWMGQYFNGRIDEVEIFDRWVDEEEILAIYQAGSAGKCKCPCGDLDGDGDVDLADFKEFQQCFTGPLPK